MARDQPYTQHEPTVTEVPEEQDEMVNQSDHQPQRPQASTSTFPASNGKVHSFTLDDISLLNGEIDFKSLKLFLFLKFRSQMLYSAKSCYNLFQDS